MPPPTTIHAPQKIIEIVRTFEIPPLATGDGDSFRFRLKITREMGAKNYGGRVYRWEYYRLQPTSPQTEGALSDWKDDAQLLVIDEAFDPEAQQGDSIQDVIANFQARLAQISGAEE